jgi:hypothetical protein
VDDLLSVPTNFASVIGFYCNWNGLALRFGAGRLIFGS